LKKTYLIPFLVILLSILFTSCSIFETSDYDKNANANDKGELDPQVLINNLMEEARLEYIDALANQSLGYIPEAIEAYEGSLSKINRLSYFPNIENNDTYNELESTIIEDYQKFVDSLKVIPEGASISALEEWSNNQIPEFIPEEISVEQDSLNSAVSGMIVVGDFPLEVNTYVEQYIEYFTGRGRKYMQAWLERSGKYFPMMAKIFEEEKVPQQLIFLSMAESGLNPTVRSWARAVGLWQFMKATGSYYDLKTDYYVDERRNPVKASRAAAQHLRDLYRSVDDWYGAIASYNCGEGRVKRAIQKAGSNNFWKYRRFLPEETRNYVPQYIAVTLIGSNPSQYGFENIRYQVAIETKTYIINEPINLSVLAKCAGIDDKLMAELNSELTQHHTPPNYGGYPLQIPSISYDYFVKNLQNIPDDAKSQYITHTVSKGETLAGIALNYKIDKNQLAKVNDISSNTRLKAKQKLKVPVAIFDVSDFILDTDEMPAIDQLTFYEDNAPYQLQVNENNDIDKYKRIYDDNKKDSIAVIVPDGKELVNYTVKNSDNLVNISEIFNVRVSELRNWNNIPYTSSIYVGQKLDIYVDKEQKDYFATIDKLDRTQKLSAINKNTTEEWIKYKVRSGETLSGIALKYNTSVSEIKKWNKLKSNRINAGKRIRIFTGSSKSSENYAQNTNSSNNKVTKVDEIITYKVRKGDTLGKIALKHGVSIKQIQKWNKLRNSNITVGKRLKIHTQTYSYSNEELADNESSTTNYKIKHGDTLGQIAEKFKMTTAKLKSMNNLTSNSIVAGTVLKVKDDGSNSSNRSRNSENDSDDIVNSIYVVKNGDTLGQIAEKFGMTTANLKSINNLTSNSISVGKKLKVKDSGSNYSDNSESEVETENSIYIVKNGDTLGQIAEKFGMTTANLKAINNLTSNSIVAGKSLKVKDDGSNSSNRSRNTENDSDDTENSVYVVKNGDTLGQIAEKFGMTTATLKSINNLTSNSISVGKKLTVSGSGENNTKSENVERRTTESEKTTYVVKNGDTIGQIAENHSVSSQNIRDWNNISGNKIKVGQKLAIYSGNSESISTSKSSKNTGNSIIHKVKEGESLWTIARHYDIHIKDIMEWNNLASDKIRPGIDLKIMN